MDPESFFSRVCRILSDSVFSWSSEPIFLEFRILFFLGDRIRIWVKPTWIRNPGQGCS